MLRIAQGPQIKYALIAVLSTSMDIPPVEQQGLRSVDITQVVTPFQMWEELPRRRITTIIVVLTLASSICCGYSVQSLPSDFSCLLARLFEIAVVSPKMSSVFMTMYENTARPSSPYASRVRVVLELRLGYLVRGAVVLKLLNVAL